MALVIGMFNHKGGVSKTTTTYNLGWMLTELGKRVLLVDTDSQCNLSSIIIGEDNLVQFYKDHPEQNIKSYLSPAFDAKPSLIEAAECVKVKTNSKLFLLPGSFDLSEYEVSLGVSFTVSAALGTLKNLPGSFNYLIQKTAQKYKADYVIVDMNPSLSAINQVLLEGSDYFIVPAMPDYFSNMAINSLTMTIPKWERWAITAREAFKDATYPFPDTTPKFLGTIIQRFNVRKGKATGANSDLIDEINKTVTEIFVPSLKAQKMVIENGKYPEDYCLGLVPDFNTLNALYQKNGIPVFALSDAQLGRKGTVLKQYQGTREEFKKLFKGIAQAIIKLIEDDKSLPAV
ncbi:ParA family protein [Sphingobacterium thalpophilum]|uniref:ParA family protein n=1 Tax=Sphingobacterium thalpophilum TaxID=259 RepID=UPI0031CFCCF3